MTRRQLSAPWARMALALASCLSGPASAMALAPGDTGAQRDTLPGQTRALLKLVWTLER